MKTLKILLAIFPFMFVTFLAFGQMTPHQDVPAVKETVTASGDNAQQASPGMEAFKMNAGTTVMVPKGAKVSRVGAQMVVESTDEYAARRLAEMDERLAKLEEQQAQLMRKIDALINVLKQALNDLP